jgi:hypothetical protein
LQGREGSAKPKASLLLGLHISSSLQINSFFFSPFSFLGAFVLRMLARVSSSVVLLFLQTRITNIINKNQSIKENHPTREHEKKKRKERTKVQTKDNISKCKTPKIESLKRRNQVT